MRLGVMENRSRFALTVFAAALLIIIGTSFALYFRSGLELSTQRLQQFRMEAQLLESSLPDDPSQLSVPLIEESLRKNGIRAQVGIYSPSGQLLLRTSTLPQTSDATATFPSPSSELQRSGNSLHSYSEQGTEIVEIRNGASSVILLSRPTLKLSSPVLLYGLSYLLISLFFGLTIAILTVRWLMKPYRRLVKEVQASQTTTTAGQNESEFVLETFQSLIEQLQVKEKELAELHQRERRRADRTERFNEKLIASIPSGLLTVSEQGQITAANDNLIRLFGQFKAFAGAQHSGQLRLPSARIPYEEYLAPSPKLVQLIGDCIQSQVPIHRGVAEVKLIDGSVRQLGLSLSPILDDNLQFEGVLCLLTDLTEVIELRERLKLQDNLVNLGEMAAGIAHEFKNSLATIQGYIQLLDLQTATAVDRSTRQQTLTIALSEVRLLTRLVTDFLNFAKPQSLTLSQTNLGELIRQCLSELQPRIQAAQVAISTSGEFPEIMADEVLLQRAFSNLLRNAIEAMESQVEGNQIEIRAISEKPSSYIHVKIADTGCGIAPDDLRKVFIPFFTTKSRGYGIGLALVQKIIIAHGGSIMVERSDARGTVFDCRLPLAAKEQPERLFTEA